MKRICRAILILLPITLAACQTGKESRPTCELTAISQVETYLNNSNGFTGQFVQTWPDGNKSEGTMFYKPGKLKLDYAVPSPMIVVAKNKQMVAKDFNSKSITHIGLARNPLGLMLHTPVHLVKPILVTSVQHVNNVLQISLASSDNPSQGLLTLSFRDVGGQLTLLQMQAVDVRQRRSIMDVYNVYPQVNIADSDFVYPDQSK